MKEKNSVCSLSLLPFIREYKISFGYVCLTCRSLMWQPTPLVRMSYQAFGKNSPPFYCPKSSARRESFIVPIHLLWSNQAASAPSLFVNLYICETVMMMWLDYLPIWYLFMNRFVNCNVTCYVHVMWVLFLWCDLLWTCDLSFVSEPVFSLRSKSGFIHIYFF